MEEIRNKIKKLNEELFVIMDEKIRIDNKYRTIENEINKLNNLENELKNKMFIKFVQMNLFKKYKNFTFIKQLSYNFIEFKFNETELIIGRAGWNKYAGQHFLYIDETRIPETHEFIKYVFDNYQLIDNKINEWRRKFFQTDFYDNYERAITFLLCTLSLFPKDISKLIANKILFFLSKIKIEKIKGIRKRKRKRKRKCTES